MKSNNYKILAVAVIGLMTGMWACSDPDMPEPTPDTTASPYTAAFMLINATPDAPSLDLAINNVKTGESIEAGEAQTTYTKVPITSNGVFANTSIRAKASTGTIGGVLAKSDLIYRAGNTNTNNIIVSDSSVYTIIVLDSISRPKPARTLNAGSFGDTTYFNPLSGKYISVVERAALSAAQKAKLSAIGTVPLGSSDPGGLRFLVILDQLPLPSTTRLPKPAAGKAAIRFINAVPDAGTATVTYDAVAVTGGILSYPLRFPTFSPSVGSRTASANFQTVDSGEHTITVKIGGVDVVSEAFEFNEKSDYTIVLSGSLHSDNLKLTVAKNK